MGLGDRLARWTDQLTERLTGSAGDRSEQDVPADPAVAGSRATGGEHTDASGNADASGDAGASGDATSVTGTAETGEFVGRTAGDDVGYAGETGAEARSPND